MRRLAILRGGLAGGQWHAGVFASGLCRPASPRICLLPLRSSLSARFHHLILAAQNAGGLPTSPAAATTILGVGAPHLEAWGFLPSAAALRGGGAGGKMGLSTRPAPEGEGEGGGGGAQKAEEGSKVAAEGDQATHSSGGGSQQEQHEKEEKARQGEDDKAHEEGREGKDREGAAEGEGGGGGRKRGDRQKSGGEQDPELPPIFERVNLWPFLWVLPLAVGIYLYASRQLLKQGTFSDLAHHIREGQVLFAFPHPKKLPPHPTALARQ